MSPPTSRAQARRKRSLVVSLVLVLVIAFGWLAATLGAGWKPLLGLDLAGGFSVVYKAPPNTSKTHLQEAAAILTSRVDALGVSGATVATQSHHEISVSVPGVKNSQTILKRIGKVDQLYFRQVLCFAPPYSTAKPATTTTTTTTTTAGPATTAATTTTAAPATTAATTTTSLPSTKASKGTKSSGTSSSKDSTPSTTTTAVQPPIPTSCSTSKSQLVVANLTGKATSGTGVRYSGTDTTSLAAFKTSKLDAQNSTVLLPGLKSTSQRFLLGPTLYTGSIVKSATAETTSLGKWEVSVTLTSAGLTDWNTMARSLFHEDIGIDLGGVVQSYPITLPTDASFTTFTSGVQISGTFTEQQAKTLSLALNYGSLPVKLTPEFTQTVSPSLGSASLKAGLGAGIAGLILVLIYTVVYYRMLGIVVVSGLAVTAALLWSIVSALGHTDFSPSFDLAGVTGIIVSIGITVDSYIVYFERLKDETRSGRTVRTSVDRGFLSAWRTVLAADLVSFFAAVVLYLVAVGDVKGFAFFLGLSTLLDIFMTYCFTRPLVILLGQNERLSRIKRFGISSGLAAEGPTGQ